MDFETVNQTQPSALPAPASVPDEATALKRNETDHRADGMDDGHEKEALETTLLSSLDTPDMPVISRNNLEFTCNNNKHDVITLQPENNEQHQATSIPLQATKPTHLASYTTPSEDLVEQQKYPISISIPTVKASSNQIINVHESQTISESASITPLDADSTQPLHRLEPEHFTMKMAENPPEGSPIPPEAPLAADQSRPTSASVTVSSSEKLSTRESIQASEHSEQASTDDASHVPQPPQSSTIVQETMAYASAQSSEASVMGDSSPESDNVHTNLSIPDGKPTDATPPMDTVCPSDTVNSGILEPCTTEDIALNPNDNPTEDLAPSLPVANVTEGPGESPANAVQVCSSSSEEVDKRQNPTSTPSIESTSQLTPDDSALFTPLPASSTTPANEAQVDNLNSDALNDQNIPAEPSDPSEAPSDAPSAEQSIPTPEHSAEATHDSAKPDKNRDEPPAKVAEAGSAPEPPHDDNVTTEALESTSGQLNDAAAMAESTLKVACSDTTPVISLDDLKEAASTTDAVPPHEPAQPTPEPASPPPIENMFDQIPDNSKPSDDSTGPIAGSASLPLSTQVETGEPTTKVDSNAQESRFPRNPDPQVVSEEEANADTSPNPPATEAEVSNPVPADVAIPVSTQDALVEVPLDTSSPADPASSESAEHQATYEVTQLEPVTPKMSDSAEQISDSHDTAVSLPKPVTAIPSPDSVLNSTSAEVNQPVPQDNSTPEHSDDVEAIEGAPAMTETPTPPEASASEGEAEAAPSPEEPSPGSPTAGQLPSDTDAANTSEADVQVTDGSSDIQQTVSAPTETPAETSPDGETAETATEPQVPMEPTVDAIVVTLTKEGELDLPTPADEGQQATEVVATEPDEPVPSAPQETDEPSHSVVAIQQAAVDSVVATEPTSDATVEASPASPATQGNLASSDTSGDPTNKDDASPENDSPVPLAVRTPESSSELPATGPVEDSPATQETQLTDASPEPLMTQVEDGAADAQLQENLEPSNISDETPTNTTDATPEQAATEPEAPTGVPAADVSIANAQNEGQEASLTLSVGKPTTLEGAQHPENAEETLITEKTADSVDQLTNSQDNPVVSDNSPAANSPVDAGLDQNTTVAPAPATEPTTAADTPEPGENIEAATAAADSSPPPKATESSEDAIEPAPTPEQASTAVPAPTTSAENPETVQKIEGAAAGADSIPSPKATDSSQVVVEATPTSEQASTVMLPDQLQTPSESDKLNPTEGETSNIPVDASADQAPADLAPPPESSSVGTTKHQEPPSTASIVADQTSTPQGSTTQDINNKNDAASQEALATTEVSTPALPEDKSVTESSTAEIADREDAPDASSTESTGTVVAVETTQDRTAEPPNVHEASAAPPVDAPAPTDTTSEADKNTESSELQEQTSPLTQADSGSSKSPPETVEAVAKSEPINEQESTPPVDASSAPAQDVTDVGPSPTVDEVEKATEVDATTSAEPVPSPFHEDDVIAESVADVQLTDTDSKVASEQILDSAEGSSPALPENNQGEANTAVSVEGSSQGDSAPPANEATAVVEVEKPPEGAEESETAPENTEGAAAETAGAVSTQGPSLNVNVSEQLLESTSSQPAECIPAEEPPTEDGSVHTDPAAAVDKVDVQASPNDVVTSDESEELAPDDAIPVAIADHADENPPTNQAANNVESSSDSPATTEQSVSLPLPTPAEPTDITDQHPDTPSPADDPQVTLPEQVPTPSADQHPEHPVSDAEPTPEDSPAAVDPVPVSSGEGPICNGDASPEQPTTAEDVPPPVPVDDPNPGSIPTDSEDAAAVPQSAAGNPGSSDSAQPASEVTPPEPGTTTAEDVPPPVPADDPNPGSIPTDSEEAVAAPQSAQPAGDSESSDSAQQQASEVVPPEAGTTTAEDVPPPVPADDPNPGSIPMDSEEAVAVRQSAQPAGDPESSDSAQQQASEVTPPETGIKQMMGSTEQPANSDDTPVAQDEATTVTTPVEAGPDHSAVEEQAPVTADTNSLAHSSPVDGSPAVLEESPSPEAPQPSTALVEATPTPEQTSDAVLPDQPQIVEEASSQEHSSSPPQGEICNVPIDGIAEPAPADPPSQSMAAVNDSTNQSEQGANLTNAVPESASTPSPEASPSALIQSASVVEPATEELVSSQAPPPTESAIPAAENPDDSPVQESTTLNPTNQNDALPQEASVTPDVSTPAQLDDITVTDQSTGEFANKDEAPDASSTESPGPVVLNDDTQDASAESQIPAEAATAPTVDTAPAQPETITQADLPRDTDPVKDPEPSPQLTEDSSPQLDSQPINKEVPAPSVDANLTPVQSETDVGPPTTVDEVEVAATSSNQDLSIVSTEAESPAAIEQTPQQAQDTSAVTPENHDDVTNCSNASGDPVVSPDDSPSVSSPAATPAATTDTDVSTTADVRADQPAMDVPDPANASQPKENVDQQPSITAAPVGPENCLAVDSLDFTPAEERAATENPSDAQDATVEAPAVPEQPSTPNANQPAEAAPPTAEELTTEGASPAHPMAAEVNDPSSQPEGSATVAELVPVVNDGNAPNAPTEVPTDSTEGNDDSTTPEQEVPAPTADTTPAGPASEEVPTSKPVGVDTVDPVTPQLDVPPATEQSTVASSAEPKSDLKSGEHADSDANSIQKPLEEKKGDNLPKAALADATVDNNPTLPPKSILASYLPVFLDSPPPSLTSVPKPPADHAIAAKVWPGAPAVSNVKREILLPARMKKLSMASTSSRHSLFVKDLATFSFPSFIPTTPKPVLNDNTSPVVSAKGPSIPVPCVSPPQNLDTSPSPPTRPKSMSSRHSKLVKPYPSLKRTRVADSVDHRAWRSSYRSVTFRNKNDPPVVDEASMVQRARSHKLIEFGTRPHSSKRRSTRMEQNNDLSDAFAIIQLSDATTYNPRADRYVNPTLSRRLSTSVKDIIQKRQNRDILKKSPLDDVYVAEDFHFDLDKELANLSESFSEDDFEPIELGAAGPSGSGQRESRIREESNVRRSVDSRPSIKESVLSNDPKGKKHHRIRSKLAGATISLSDKIARF